MIHLLKLEWAKFRNNNVIVLLCLLYVVLLPSLTFIGKQINLPAPFPSNKIFFEFPTTWDWSAYGGSWMVFFFLGFIALFMITSEISYKTMRQNIISGMTRIDYFMGKVITIVIISLLATIYYAIVTGITGLIHTETITEILPNNTIILRYFLMSLGYMSFGLLIGFTVKKSSLATLVYMVYILFLEMILKWIFIMKVSSAKWAYYWPLNTIEDLTPNPFSQQIDDMSNKVMPMSYIIPYNEAIIVSSVYIILFLAIAYYFFNKRDL